MFIFGTRPEFIKVYPIIKEIEKSNSLQSIIVSTGQHREMLDSLLTEFTVTLDYDLAIMQKSNGLTDILINSLSGLDKVIKKENPDMILVHGDTSATLAGSIQAFYHRIPLGHIEAGLRTFNLASPFPEEGNRQVTGIFADLNFAPTETAKKYLLAEGKRPESIHVVGNSSIDMLNYTIDADYKHELEEWLAQSKMILITAHRRENLGQMVEMFEAINHLAEVYSDFKFLYPVHLNPQIQKKSKELLTADNIKLTTPLGTKAFHNIMNRAHIILTDSGGIQEEAPSLGKPVLVMRNTTERPEGVAAGTLKLIGTQKQSIIDNVTELLENKTIYNQMAETINPYGSGDTSIQIRTIIEDYFK